MSTVQVSAAVLIEMLQALGDLDRPVWVQVADSIGPAQIVQDEVSLITIVGGEPE